MDNNNKNSGMQEKSTTNDMVEELNVKLEGTPFVRRKTEDGYIITMGNHRITEPTDTAKKAEDLIYKLNWLTLIRVIATAVENVLDERTRIAKEEITEMMKKEGKSIKDIYKAEKLRT